MKGRILIVDDESAIRELCREALGGYELEEAQTFWQAASKLAQSDYDVLVSDITLPEGSGLDLAQKLRTPEGEVIFISGTATDATLAYAERLGIFAFIPKPFSASQLTESVQKALAVVAERRARKGLSPEDSEGTILIADDHDEVRRLLAEILRRRGYWVDEAADGEEAVQKVERRGYDVVLMDIRMPKMTGTEAVERIKSFAPRTFVVMMTGEATEAEIEASLERHPGHDAVLRKPFSATQFLVMVKNLKLEAQGYQRRKDEEEAFARAPLTTRASVRAKEKWRLVKAFLAMPMVTQWVLIVLFSLGMGVLLFLAIQALQGPAGFIARVKDFMQNVQEYLERDEQRELKRPGY